VCEEWMVCISTVLHVFPVLGMEPWASCMLGRSSATRLHSKLRNTVFKAAGSYAGSLIRTSHRTLTKAPLWLGSSRISRPLFPSSSQLCFPFLLKSATVTLTTGLPLTKTITEHNRMAHLSSCLSSKPTSPVSLNVTTRLAYFPHF
jgi:hypothetical protein